MTFLVNEPGSISKRLLLDSHERCRKLLLGEVRRIRFHNQQGALEGVLVVHLTENKWHKWIRQHLRRDNFYRRYSESLGVGLELRPGMRLASDRKVWAGKTPYFSPLF